MKFIKKEAECVSITTHNNSVLYDWRCPTCGMGVSDDYICCPYCRQKLTFTKPNKGIFREFNLKLYGIGGNDYGKI